MLDTSCNKCIKKKLQLVHAGIDNSAINYYIEWLHPEHELAAQEDNYSALLTRFTKVEQQYALKIYDHLKYSNKLLDIAALLEKGDTK